MRRCSRCDAVVLIGPTSSARAASEPRNPRVVEAEFFLGADTEQVTLEVAVNEILRTAAELQFEIRRRPIHFDVVDIDRENIRAGRDDADACGGTSFRCEYVDVNDRE